MSIITKGLMAGAAGLAAVVMSAGPASAHHCFFVEPNSTADYNRMVHSGVFVPLSDLIELFEGETIGGCAATYDYLAMLIAANHGMDSEPLVNTKATMGGGAAHIAGNEPPPFDYLGDADFDTLIGGVEDGLALCD